MFEYTNYTKPTRIGHQADQERLGYSNYTKPTRIGHQADQDMLGYSNADQERLGYTIARRSAMLVRRKLQVHLGIPRRP